MTKSDIVNELSEKTGTEKSTVLKTAEAFMETLKESLVDGKNAYQRGFGCFVIKKRAKKLQGTYQKNTFLIIPACNILSFKPAKTFLNKIKQATNSTNPLFPFFHWFNLFIHRRKHSLNKCKK
jgi:DNA-binding protein HU-beta